MKCIINIILLLYSFSLFPLPLDFWKFEKASLPCVDNDKHYNHGLVVWDGDPVGPSHSLDIELEDVEIGEAVVVVYDVTNQSSFCEAVKLVQLYTRRHISVSPEFVDLRVVVLVGSKADLLMDTKIKYEV